MNDEKPKSIDEDVREYGLIYPEIVISRFANGEYSHDEKSERHAREVVKRLVGRQVFSQNVREASDWVMGVSILASMIIIGYQVWHWFYYGWWKPMNIFSLFDFLGLGYGSVISPESWVGLAKVAEFLMSMNLALFFFILALFLKLAYVAVAFTVYNKFHDYP